MRDRVFVVASLVASVIFAIHWFWGASLSRILFAAIGALVILAIDSWVVDAA